MHTVSHLLDVLDGVALAQSNEPLLELRMDESVDGHYERDVADLLQEW